jgi:hypothetical protein
LAGVGGDVDGLGHEGFEVHLDAGLYGVPAGSVTEAGYVEAGLELAVQTIENIEVKGGGDVLRVVIGGEEGLDGLVAVGGEVGAEEEGVAGAELGS